jgi:hypothetical protein
MYLDEVTSATDRTADGLPVPDRESEMDEVEATANGFLNLTPDESARQKFSRDLFSDPGR